MTLEALRFSSVALGAQLELEERLAFAQASAEGARRRNDPACAREADELAARLAAEVAAVAKGGGVAAAAARAYEESHSVWGELSQPLREAGLSPKDLPWAALAIVAAAIGRRLVGLAVAWLLQRPQA